MTIWFVTNRKCSAVLAGDLFKLRTKMKTNRTTHRQKNKKLNYKSNGWWTGNQVYCFDGYARYSCSSITGNVMQLKRTFMSERKKKERKKYIIRSELSLNPILGYSHGNTTIQIFAPQGHTSIMEFFWWHLQWKVYSMWNQIDLFLRFNQFPLQIRKIWNIFL